MIPAGDTGSLTAAERIEFLSRQLAYYRDLSIRLTQQLHAATNTPETHTGRGLHPDPTGNLAAARVDRQQDRKASECRTTTSQKYSSVGTSPRRQKPIG